MFIRVDLWFLAFFLSFPAFAGITLKDDLGRTVELKGPAQRIVCLAPFLTELVFSAGAGDRVVGVSAFSDYPPEVKQLPVVSNAVGVSLEQVAALKPDLVLAWRDSFRREELDRLQALGAAVFVSEGRRLDDVPRLLRAIGTATGRDVALAAADFDAKLAGLRRAYAGRRELSAFIEIWHRPLTTISGRHFMDDALSICRARNVFQDLGEVAPQVSWEALYERNPFAIVGMGSASSEAQFRANWKQRPTLPAVKADRLVWVDADAIQRPTTRTPAGIAQLCERLDRLR